MALSNEVAYTTTGTKASINLDPSISPFNASIRVNVGTTGTYGLQFSLSGPDVTDAAAIWFDSANIPAGTAASATTNLMFPVSRARVVIAAISGTITLQALQGYTNN